MMAPGHLDPVHDIVRGGAYPKVTRILEGAGTRNDTTRAAIDAISQGSEAATRMLRPAARRASARC